MDLPVSAMYAVREMTSNARSALALALMGIGAQACGDSAPVEPIRPQPQPVSWSTPFVLASGGNLVLPLQLEASGTDLHLLAKQASVPERLLLFSRIAGMWRSPEVIAEHLQINHAQFGIDSSGDLHFTWFGWENTTDGAAWHRQRSGEAWLAAQALHDRLQEVEGLSPILFPLAAASDGDGVHFVFSERGRDTSAIAVTHDRGEWRADRIGTGWPFASPSFFVEAAQHRVLVYQGSGGVWTLPRRDGGWGPRKLAWSSGPGTAQEPRVAVERNGRRHLVWGVQSGRPQLLHSTSDDGLTWTAPTAIMWALPRDLTLAIDGHDRLHLVFVADDGPYRLYRRFENGAWSPPAALPVEPAVHMNDYRMAFGGDSRLHAVWWRSLGGVLFHSSLDVSK